MVPSLLTISPLSPDIERRERRHVDDVGVLGAERRRSAPACRGRRCSGPITVAPPSSCSILVEIEAEWKAGMTSTLAGPVRRQNG